MMSLTSFSLAWDVMDIIVIIIERGNEADAKSISSRGVSKEKQK